MKPSLAALLAQLPSPVPISSWQEPSPGEGFQDLLRLSLRSSELERMTQLAQLLVREQNALGGDPSFPQSDPTLTARQRGIPLAWLTGTASPRQATGVEKATPSAPAPARAAGDRRHDFDDLIRQAARRHGVDEHLVRAVITAESDFDPTCVSSAGAMGLMQLMPETARDLGVQDPFDPAQNIDAGVRYLAMLLERFDGDEKKALAAYNWGPSHVEAGGRLPSETRNYLRKVARFKALYAGGFQTLA